MIIAKLASKILLLLIVTFAILNLLNSLSLFDGNSYQFKEYVRQIVFLKSLGVTLIFLLGITAFGYTFYPQIRSVKVPLFILSITCAIAYNYSSVTYQIGGDWVRRNSSYQAVMFGLQDIFSDKIVFQYNTKLFGKKNFGIVRPRKVVNIKMAPLNASKAIRRLKHSSDYEERGIRYAGKKYILGFSKKLSLPAETVHLLAGKEKENKIKLFITPQSLLPNDNSNFEIDFNQLFNKKIIHIKKGTKFSKKINNALISAEKIISYQENKKYKHQGETLYFIQEDIEEGVRSGILYYSQTVLNEKEVYLETNGSSSIAEFWLTYKKEVQ